MRGRCHGEQAATSNHLKEESNNARCLGYELTLSQLGGGLFRRVRAQKDAHHVIPVTFFCFVPENVAREVFRKIQKLVEPTVLA
jgi:hypothetical protein